MVSKDVLGFLGGKVALFSYWGYLKASHCNP